MHITPFVALGSGADDVQSKCEGDRVICTPQQQVHIVKHRIYIYIYVAREVSSTLMHVSRGDKRFSSNITKMVFLPTYNQIGGRLFVTTCFIGHRSGPRGVISHDSYSHGWHTYRTFLSPLLISSCPSVSCFATIQCPLFFGVFLPVSRCLSLLPSIRINPIREQAGGL